MTTPTLDATLTAVADWRRRAVLTLLRTESTPVELFDLAARVVEFETVRSSASGDDPGSHVATSLHHTHLPTLDRAGLLRYDAADRQVTTVREDRIETALVDAARAVRAVARPGRDDADGERRPPHTVR